MRNTVYKVYTTLIVLAFLSCGQSTEATNVEGQEPTSTPPSTIPGKELKDIVEYYNDSFIEMGPVSYIEAWDKWLIGTEEVQGQYKSYAEYLEENPFSVTVDQKNGYLQLVDPGTGGGSFTITATLFKKDDGSYVFARTEVAATPEETETELFFGDYTDGKWKKIEVLPAISSSTFFSDKKAITDQYAIVSVIYTLPQNGTDIIVKSSPNYGYHCKNGSFPAAHTMTVEEVKGICAAWKFYEGKDLVLKWNRETGKFEL